MTQQLLSTVLVKYSSSNVSITEVCCLERGNVAHQRVQWLTLLDSESLPITLVLKWMLLPTKCAALRKLSNELNTQQYSFTTIVSLTNTILKEGCQLLCPTLAEQSF